MGTCDTRPDLPSIRIAFRASRLPCCTSLVCRPAGRHAPSRECRCLETVIARLLVTAQDAHLIGQGAASLASSRAPPWNLAVRAPAPSTPVASPTRFLDRRRNEPLVVADTPRISSSLFPIIRGRISGRIFSGIADSRRRLRARSAVVRTRSWAGQPRIVLTETLHLAGLVTGRLAETTPFWPPPCLRRVLRMLTAVLPEPGPRILPPLLLLPIDSGLPRFTASWARRSDDSRAAARTRDAALDSGCRRPSLSVVFSASSSAASSSSASSSSASSVSSPLSSMSLSSASSSGSSASGSSPSPTTSSTASSSSAS